MLVCLNAPFGARCFLTMGRRAQVGFVPIGLNAPFDARCFLTERHVFIGVDVEDRS